MNKLILIGKNSYIGRYLTAKWAAQNQPCLALSSRDCDFLKTRQVCDFFDTLDDAATHTVVFLAVINKPVNTFQAFLRNIRMVENLILGMKRARIGSVVYFSTVDVYGLAPVLPITEQTKMAPDSWYGLAKQVSEWMLLSAGAVACPVTVLRLPGIYGSAPNDHSVVGRMVSDIRTTHRATIHGTGTTLRDHVYIYDLWRLVDRLVKLGHHGVLNVATGEGRSLIDILRLIGRVLNLNFEIEFAGEDKRCFDLKFDIGILKALLPDFKFSDMTVGLASYGLQV
jgi:nucleoside-diphosphate-sugar epimerase